MLPKAPKILLEGKTVVIARRKYHFVTSFVGQRKNGRGSSLPHPAPLQSTIFIRLVKGGRKCKAAMSLEKGPPEPPNLNM